MHGLRAPPRRGARRRLQKGRALIQDRLKLTTGRAAFADDLEVAGGLTACVLRSPHARAKLTSIDASAARALPGTIAVLAALEVEEGREPILDPVARFVGAPWAAVAAEDRELAEHAAAAIRFVATLETPVFDPATSPTTASASAHEGDVEAAFRKGAGVAVASYGWPFGALAPVEPPTSLSWLDEDGRLVVRATTNAPFTLRAQLALALGLPASGLRVVRPQVGAPFGGALEPRDAALCAALTLRTGRPVRLVESVSLGPAPREAAHRVELRTAWREDRLVAVDCSLVLNLGAASADAQAALEGATDALHGAGLEAFRVRARAGATNLPPLADARRVAARAVRFALEGAWLDAARSRGVDPLTFRLASAPPELRAALRAGASALDWVAVDPVDEAGPMKRGRGVALAGPWSAAGASASAGLTLNQDGSFALRLGAGGVSAGVGQVLLDRAAAVLGTAPDRFSIVAADTDSAPAEEMDRPEPQLIARAVERAASHLSELAVAGARQKKPGSAEATATLEASDLPAVVAAVFAEVELDTETGIARARRLVVAQLHAEASPLAAWEDGQLAAALPLVFGGSARPTAFDVPKITRATEGAATTGALIPPLADLLPAAAAALAHAIGSAASVSVRELPVQPATLLGQPKTA